MALYLNCGVEFGDDGSVVGLHDVEESVGFFVSVVFRVSILSSCDISINTREYRRGDKIVVCKMLTSVSFFKFSGSIFTGGSLCVCSFIIDDVRDA